MTSHCRSVVTALAAVILIAPATSSATNAATWNTSRVRVLAARLLAVYREPNRATFLDNRFRLELAAGHYANAASTIRQLRELEDPSHPQSATVYTQYAVFAAAMLGRSSGRSFADRFRAVFRRAIGGLNDVDAAYVDRQFTILSDPQMTLRNDLAEQGSGGAIPQASLLKLVRDYDLAEFYRAVQPEVNELVRRDDEKRYTIDGGVRIATPDHRTVCVYVVRKRAEPRLPSLLEYSIYADRRIVYQDARLSAAHGYAGVNAYTPGTACSDGPIVPYINEGLHADAVIEWIGRQPWSDGRVGMFGGSYGAFAVWAAAKHAPRQLKALMSGVSNAPGIDTPMERNIFETWVYPWPLYTHAQWLNAGTESSPIDLASLQRRWYVSGKSYRSLDEIAGVQNPIWNSWVDHPAYDAFWQRLIPYRSDFARIHLPALLTDGYLGGQNVGGLYYFQQYHRYSPGSAVYLVVGPYDHLAGQFGTVQSSGQDKEAIDGQPIDAAAHIDMQELRYEWFDYTFLKKRKPALLGASINYEVMHGNHWEHAASLEKMGPQHLRIFMRDVSQSVDFADRSDVDRSPPTDGLDAYLGNAYSSATFKRPIEFNGVFTGRLHFTCNKNDFDFNVAIYQQFADGRYEAITNYMARASYVNHPDSRTLLTPQQPTTLNFTSSRVTAWKIESGSRIVAVVSIVKDPGLELNYGGATPVADQSIADATTPLSIHWFGDGFIDIPIRHLAPWALVSVHASSRSGCVRGFRES